MRKCGEEVDDVTKRLMLKLLMPLELYAQYCGSMSIAATSSTPGYYSGTCNEYPTFNSACTSCWTNITSLF